jgi:putative spermidine/putrescine transport system permease protein
MVLPSSRTSSRLACWARTVAAIATVGLSLGPVTLLVVTSVARQWYWPAVLPPEYSLRAWTDIASPSSGVIPALVTSGGIALAVTALALIVGLPAARALGLNEFRGKRIVAFLLLLPVLTPPLASVMGVHAIFLRFGLTDSLLGVILVHLIPAVPYCALMLSSSFANFDTDWEAQARTLGASRLATWRYVTLPAIAPGVAIAAVFAFLISWSQYLLTLFVGGGHIITLPLLLVAFQRSGDQAIAAALSLVFLAPTLALFAVAARFLKHDPSSV